MRWGGGRTKIRRCDKVGLVEGIGLYYMDMGIRALCLEFGVGNSKPGIIRLYLYLSKYGRWGKVYHFCISYNFQAQNTEGLTYMNLSVFVKPTPLRCAPMAKAGILFVIPNSNNVDQAFALCITGR